MGRLDDEAFRYCDVLMVIGTSCVTYPASVYAPQVAARWDTVAEFNKVSNKSHPDFQFHFPGPYSITVPMVLDYDDHEQCDDK
ncbi:NAD-dependent protein deacylase sirtuin-5, mitochondrial [Eumeta japonica]|uniref:NAD-dependent protein deacylase sirtuin-5, mitochondrial n=1 Tax=Eumeta variegata TaxID=151549 RepID=A0A4C1XGE2_EUMVA|nr:NAD-dependent protein deacylase sirtuin-5, mitochondrial [Eumeta japonica]